MNYALLGKTGAVMVAPFLRMVLRASSVLNSFKKGKRQGCCFAVWHSTASCMAVNLFDVNMALLYLEARVRSRHLEEHVASNWQLPHKRWNGN